MTLDIGNEMRTVYPHWLNKGFNSESPAERYTHEEGRAKRDNNTDEDNSSNINNVNNDLFIIEIKTSISVFFFISKLI